MKNKYIIVLTITAGAALASCQQKESSIFADPTSARMEKYLDHVQDVISHPRGGFGWSLAYFTEQDKTPGGTVYTVQFDKPAAGEATIFHESVKPAEGWGDTCTYRLTRDDGPVLSFDTYNVAMHYYATSSPEYYQSMGGDFEFEVFSACADSVVMRGKRSQLTYKMYPLEEAPDTYLEKIVAMSQDMTLGLVEAEITGGLIRMEFDLEGRFITIGRKDAEEAEKVTVPYRYTPTGISLYEPLDFQGVIFKDFTYDPDNLSVISNGITFKMVIPEGYMPYSKFAGKYTLKNALGTREVTLAVKEAGRSFTLSGLSAQYTLDVKYSAGQGGLMIYVQQVGTIGTHQVWLLVTDGSYITWSTSAAVKTVVDDVEKEDFTLSFKDAGLYPDVVASGFWMAEFNGAPSSSTYISGGVSSAAWMFFEKDPEMSFPITMTKIVE